MHLENTDIEIETSSSTELGKVEFVQSIYSTPEHMALGEDVFGFGSNCSRP